MDEAIELAKLEQRCRSNTHRIDDLEKRQNNLDKLVSRMDVMANEQEHIKTDVGEIKSSVRTLVDKPGKRWDSIVDKLIWLVVSGGIGFLLAVVGLK